MFGRFARSTSADVLFRVVIALLGFMAMFYPDDTIGTIAAIAAVIGTMLGVSRHRHVAPLAQLKTQPAT
jgi:hypothetical protein